jgi:hypothetical protein
MDPTPPIWQLDWGNKSCWRCSVCLPVEVFVRVTTLVHKVYLSVVWIHRLIVIGPLYLSFANQRTSC